MIVFVDVDSLAQNAHLHYIAMSRLEKQLAGCQAWMIDRFGIGTGLREGSGSSGCPAIVDREHLIYDREHLIHDQGHLIVYQRHANYDCGEVSNMTSLPF